ncbi:MAG: 50S ribosomal protein L4 [Syntrophales bacterium]|nr:50S ribosomal protein L4 [Syntrophales bacterium]MDD5643776.1 50S ribosomal protein L4 [Syntrophales bacterium]
MPIVDVLNIQNEKVGEVELQEEIFGVPVRGHVLHEVVTWQRACRRGGNASTKSRGEVRGGGRKPWRQKGTGRARVGSTRSPIWRGGGTVFGPKPRSYAYTLPKKVRRLALKMALSSKLQAGQLLVLDEYPHTTPKTKDFVQVLRNFEIAKVLIIAPEAHQALELSARNVPYVQVMLPAGLNVYDILRYEHLVMLKPALAQIEERLAP